MSEWVSETERDTDRETVRKRERDRELFGDWSRSMTQGTCWYRTSRSFTSTQNKNTSARAGSARVSYAMQASKKERARDRADKRRRE